MLFLESQGFAGDQVKGKVQTVINSLISKENLTTESAIRGAIADGLIGQGFPTTIAINASKEAILDAKTSQGINPLTSLGSDSFLSTTELKTAIAIHVSKSLSGELGKEEAEKIAKEFNEALLNEETGVVALIEKEIDAIKSVSTGRPFEGALGNLRDISNIPHEVYAILKAIEDPVMGLIGTLTPQRGDSYKKSIDIPI